MLAATAAVGMAGADAPPRSLEIYFIDMMGGAATLVVTPERESILIDSGSPGLEDRDPGRIVHVLRDVARFDHLDHLVTTHWHGDHFGGVEGLTNRVRIDHFWDRGLPEDRGVAAGEATGFPDGPTADDPLGLAYREASKGKRQALQAGDGIPLKGKIELRVLASGGRVVASSDGPPNPLCAEAPADQPRDRSDNALSLALRVRFGAFDFLDCGDLTWNVEKQLVCPRDLIGPIDLFQVTHHGLASSNHPTLVKTIAPTVAIMNNGPLKGGAAETVELLKSVPSIQAAYQLHRNALTTAEQNTGQALIANTDSAGGEFIRVAVTPDGRSFNVHIGPDGSPRTFESR
jgi:hypothetical protein